MTTFPAVPASRITGWSVALLVWMGSIVFVAADDAFWWGANATQPVPAGAKVTLELDRAEYFIGENVLIHFVLENAGAAPFEASFGGDYRGSSRSLRFKVTATDEAGRAAEDPDPSPMNFGGMGGSRTLKPGEKFIQSLPLMRYGDIDHAGRYTIRATHDFGWKEGDRKRPVGETTIVFRMPDATQAEQIIVQMEKLPADPNASFGQKSRNYADFTCLRQPVYLEPLLRRARDGNQRALSAVGQMATPDATEALIQLAGDPGAKLAFDAALTLKGRLPNPGVTDKANPRAVYRSEVRQRLVSRSWNDQFAPDVRGLATNLVARKEARDISCGAYMIQAVGTTNEVASVNAAMDRALDPLVSPRRDAKDNILDFPEPLPELLRAMDLLHSQGFTLREGALLGNAQILLYFRWLANDTAPRSSRWPELLEAFGAGNRFPVNETAVRSIPRPVPPSCISYLKGRLEDPDLGVCRAACQVAGESGRSEFVEPLLRIVATENHEWLIREAADAAETLGAGFDLLMACADRLSDEKLYPIALDHLQTVVEGLGGSHSGRTDLTRGERLELRSRWKEFLSAHANEIKAGKRFTVRDPAITPALFGRARAWHLADGTDWPMNSADQAKQPGGR